MVVLSLHVFYEFILTFKTRKKVSFTCNSYFQYNNIGIIVHLNPAKLKALSAKFEKSLVLEK